MTVKELIEKLKEFDENLPVIDKIEELVKQLQRCCECGRVLNNQTDECFVLENGDVICEDCIDYQIYTEEME